MKRLGIQMRLVKDIGPTLKFIELRFTVIKGLTQHTKTKQYALSFSHLD